MYKRIKLVINVLEPFHLLISDFKSYYTFCLPACRTREKRVWVVVDMQVSSPNSIKVNHKHFSSSYRFNFLIILTVCDGFLYRYREIPIATEQNNHVTYFLKDIQGILYSSNNENDNVFQSVLEIPTIEIEETFVRRQQNGLRAELC